MFMQQAATVCLLKIITTLGLTKINRVVPQRSVLGPLFFLLFIDDLNQALKFCKACPCADVTNLLCFGKSIKKL